MLGKASDENSDQISSIRIVKPAIRNDSETRDANKKWYHALRQVDKITRVWLKSWLKELPKETLLKENC